jgi:integrase/recombinase XerC
VLEIRPPKVPRPLPRALSVDAISLLVSAPDVRTAEGLRDRAILETLYAAGLHAHELVELRLDDLDLDLSLNGLGSVTVKDHTLPLSSSCVTAVQRYLMRRAELRPQDRTLFIDYGGAPLSADRVRRVLLPRYAIGLGRVTPRMIRTTFAAHLLDGGASLRVVQILLRHRSIKATTIYEPLAVGTLIAVYDASHPLAHYPEGSSRDGRPRRQRRA